MSSASAAPLGGTITAGSGSITQAPGATTVMQAGQSLSVNWQSFNVAPNEIVRFLQPNSAAVAVNRILDLNGSRILGQISAKGQVFLINPNGVLFGPGARIDVGGLVASTLDVRDESAQAAARRFSSSGTGSIVNQGILTAADGGYIALLGNHVSNQGRIDARLGTVALGAGSAIVLTFSDNRLINLQVDQSTINNLAENKQLIQADGGQVILAAGAKESLLASVVNNSGVIEAHSVGNRNGRIVLLGGMEAGQVDLDGRLDASAPGEGNGGFVETSAAHVRIASSARVTTTASQGKAGNWLIDPADYTVAAAGGDMTGAALSANLAATDVTILSSSGSGGANGDIHVNDVISWSADHTLTLSAQRNININANISATGNAAGLVLTPGTGGAGDYFLNNGAKVTLSGSAPGLSIGGNAYTVINSLGAAGDISGTTLQGMLGSLSGRYALGSDINATATSGWNGGSGFQPIGSSGSPFSGKLEGLGHTISNLAINLPATNGVGLFGEMTGEVRNVGVTGAAVSGANNAGVLAGTNGGTIRYSYATGTISGVESIGGLAGVNSGTISNSYATSNVTGTNVNIGGLVGYSNSSITGSHAGGTVQGHNLTGGLVGNNNGGAVSGSYASGAVQGTADVTGGLVGQNAGNIDNSYASGAVQGVNLVGGLVGNHISGTVSNSHAAGTVSGVDNAGGLAGVSSSTVGNSYATGDVTGTNSSTGGLVGYNTGSITGSHAAGAVQGRSMTGGLVGNNNGGAISNSYATGAVQSTADATGGLIGQNAGDVDNSYASGAIHGVNLAGGLVGNHASGTVSNSYATGAVSGADSVGGLAGSNSGTLGNGYATGQVSGATQAGGLVGVNAGTVNSSYWDTTTSGMASGIGAGTNAGASGLATASAMQRTSYAGWDFATPVWTMYEGHTYPLLSAFLRPLTITSTSATQPYQGAAYTGAASGLSYSDTGAAASGHLFGTSPYNTAIRPGTYAPVPGYWSDQQGYAITYVNNGSLTITPKTLTVTGAGAADKIYDGTTAVSLGGSLSGVIGGDLVALNMSGQFADKNAGTGKAVSVSASLYGADAGNYTLSQPAGLTANITPKALTVAGASAADKVYDGTTAATISGATLSGTLGGDTISLGTTGQFADKNAGTGKAVIVSASLYGADAGNYTLVQPAGLTANITPKALTVAGAGAADKVYDGTTAATIGGALAGVIGNDMVGLNKSGQFADKNVGTGKAVSVSASLYGTDAGNYTLVQPAGLTANITPKALTVTAAAANKVYDGTTAAAVTLSGSGMIAGDAVGFSLTSAAFADKNAGAAKTVTVSGIAITGADSGNYALGSRIATTVADITPATLTYIAAPATIMVGQTASNLSGTIAGFLAGDDLSNATSGKLTWTTPVAATVGPGNYRIDGTGLSAANYLFAQAAGNATALTIKSPPLPSVGERLSAGLVPMNSFGADAPFVRAQQANNSDSPRQTENMQFRTQEQSFKLSDFNDADNLPDQQ